MSHASHRKAVRDPTRPFMHRASHARSCVNHVAARLGMSRDDVIDLVMARTDIDLRMPADEEALLKAFETLEAMTCDDPAKP